MTYKEMKTFILLFRLGEINKLQLTKAFELWQAEGARI